MSTQTTNRAWLRTLSLTAAVLLLLVAVAAAVSARADDTAVDASSSTATVAQTNPGTAQGPAARVGTQQRPFPSARVAPQEAPPECDGTGPRFDGARPNGGQQQPYNQLMQGQGPMARRGNHVGPDPSQRRGTGSQQGSPLRWGSAQHQPFANNRPQSDHIPQRNGMSFPGFQRSQS